MARNVALVASVVVAVLALGAGASAQTTQLTPVVVYVLGAGTVTSSPAGISCGEGKRDCFEVFTGTGSVTLTADPGDGRSVEWRTDSDNCDDAGTSRTCTYTLDGTDANEDMVEFTVIGGEPQATLRVDPEPDDGSVIGGELDCGSASLCDWEVPLRSVLTVRPYPASGFVFTGWTGSCSGIGQACTVSLTATTSVSATFDEDADREELEVVVAGSGRVSAPSPYQLDCTANPSSTCVAQVLTSQSVTLTATADSGATFTGWSEDAPASCGTATTCTVQMTEAKEVKATFSTSTTPPPPSGGTTFALTVSVTGSGKVTGSAINCGGGSTTCTANRPAGTTATLTAEPAAGAAFRGWGGACASAGTTPDCTVTMSAARNVTATFSTPTPGGGSRATLTLRVTGAGVVSTSGGTCSSSGGTKTCSQSYTTGTRVTLTASAPGGFRFSGWSGACTGAATTCTVTMSAARTVTATFVSTSRTPTSTRALKARAAPLIARSDSGYDVTLLLTSTRRGTVRMRALRAGRVQTSLTFVVAPGRVRIGPFPVARSGFYIFEVTLARGGVVRQQACLGKCGAAANAAPLVVTRKAPRISRTGAIWSVTLRFHTTVPVGAVVRLLRGKKLVREHRFAPETGAGSAGPFLLSPGTYTLRLSVLDAYGQRKTLSWVAVLP